MANLFPSFLTDESEYRQAEAFWRELWASTPEFDRNSAGWRDGWFVPQPPLDGNPIFTAISETKNKAVRVIQYEPTSNALDINFWIDTFGGSRIDPEAIRELVISCALSNESAAKARQLISSWLIGEIEVASSSHSSRGLALIRTTRPRWTETAPDTTNLLAGEHPDR